MHKVTVLLMILALFVHHKETKAQLKLDVNYESFLSQHDMVWYRILDCWQVAPFTGNGNIGFLLYQIEGKAKNTMGKN